MKIVAACPTSTPHRNVNKRITTVIENNGKLLLTKSKNKINEGWG